MNIVMHKTLKSFDLYSFILYVFFVIMLNKSYLLRTK